jgi:hypothetical protein
VEVLSSRTRTQAAPGRVRVPLPLRRRHMPSNQARALRTGASRHARRRRRRCSGRRTGASLPRCDKTRAVSAFLFAG